MDLIVLTIEAILIGIYFGFWKKNAFAGAFMASLIIVIVSHF